jgi:DNA mismatch repair protein MutH
MPRRILAPISEAVSVVLSEAICQRGEKITTMHMLFYSTNQFITSMTTTIDYTTHERLLLKCPQTS